MTDKAEAVERFRLAGEHEEVGELLLAWNEDVATTLEQLIGLASPKVRTTVIVDPAYGEDKLRKHLAGVGVDTEQVGFLEIPVEAPWVRDFGPVTLIGSRGGRLILDFDYTIRPNADKIPSRLVERLWPESTIVHSDLVLDGGNLISDGFGTCVTAFADDSETDLIAMRSLLVRHGACSKLVVVPALHDEPTGHVDMFTFSPGPGRFVVGSYSAERDAINARRLDQAAEQLENQGLWVTRIPMPDNSDGRFRTYTNLLPLGDMVLVPTYDDEASREIEALRVISEAYPGREVIGLDAQESIELEGALHCLAQTVPAALSGQR